MLESWKQIFQYLDEVELSNSFVWYYPTKEKTVRGKLATEMSSLESVPMLNSIQVPSRLGESHALTEFDCNSAIQFVKGHWCALATSQMPKQVFDR